jgi:hypothetical protein
MSLRWRLLLILAPVLVGALGLLVFFPAYPGITVGMTEEEVIAIIGLPDHRTWTRSEEGVEPTHIWLYSQYAVLFNNGRVSGTNAPPPQSRFERIRSWLAL